MIMSRQPYSMRYTARVALAVIYCIVMIATALWGEVGNASAQEGLTVTASFGAGKMVSPDTAIELRLSRALRTDEGHVAVIIGRADVTSLFIVNETRLVYSPALVPLPLGESRVVVYLVHTD